MAHLFFGFIARAAAADVDVGGAVDVLNTTTFAPSVQGALALRQVEGDLAIAGEHVSARFDLDFNATLLSNGALLTVYGLAPEQATVRYHTGAFFVEGGIAPGPWRIEKVDPWDNAFSAFSMNTLLLPGSILGGSIGMTGAGFTGQVVAGLDAPRYDVFHLSEFGERNFGPIVGVDGAYATDAVTLRAGAWSRPTVGPLFGVELGVRVNVGIVGGGVELVGNSNRAIGGQAEVAIWPSGVISPMGRFEYADAFGPGGGLGVASTLVKVVRLKAEVDYQNHAPAAYLEVSIASPWPPAAAVRERRRPARDG